MPTIGIGTSCAGDAQILVSEDMLGVFYDFKLKFVHQFSELLFIITAAAVAYQEAVSYGTFQPRIIYMALSLIKW